MPETARKLCFILSCILVFGFAFFKVLPSTVKAAGVTNLRIEIKPAPSSGSGGNITSVTSVSFSGRVYPLSKVTVLKDGQIAITTIAGPDANFNASLTGLSAGNYIFAIFGEDNQGRQSSLFTFSLFLTRGASTNVGGIFIAPTIAVDKSEVKHGENIAIFGQSIPESKITILVNSHQEIINQVKADASGAYLYNFNTLLLEAEEHSAKSISILNGEVSLHSQAVSFTVGARTIPASPLTAAAKGDLNGDNRVNLIDFSIAAYWYNRPSPPTSIDLNSDGKVDLIDFSIMVYYWTG